MEEHHHHHLLLLSAEATALDSRTEAAAAKMEAARAAGDGAELAMHTKIYENLVDDKKALNAMRAVILNYTGGRVRLGSGGPA